MWWWKCLTPAPWVRTSWALPEAAELVAAGGQLADELVQPVVVRVLPGRGAEVGDGHLRGHIPARVKTPRRVVEEGLTGEFGFAPRVERRSAYMARPRWLAARKSTTDRSRRSPVRVVMASRVHCRLGRTVHSWARGAAQNPVGAVRLPGQARADRSARRRPAATPGRVVRHTGRYPGEGAAFELRVILQAHPRELRDLVAPQTGHPTPRRLRQPGLLGADLGAPGGGELARPPARLSMVEEITSPTLG